MSIAVSASPSADFDAEMFSRCGGCNGELELSPRSSEKSSAGSAGWLDASNIGDIRTRFPRFGALPDDPGSAPDGIATGPESP